MQRKDIPTKDVIQACKDFHTGSFYITKKAPWELLVSKFNAPVKVVYAAMERDCDKGYIEYGVSLRTAWPTPKGLDFLKE